MITLPVEFQYISCYGSIWMPFLIYMIHLISIHLMLWFYKEEQKLVDCNLNFNTSHVMVLWRYELSNNRVYQISIHLMLWFYIVLSLVFLSQTDFNTSHVMVLSKSQTEPKEGFRISIHLMLWFYKSCLIHVSYHLVHFNTSHVMVL